MSNRNTISLLSVMILLSLKCHAVFISRDSASVIAESFMKSRGLAESRLVPLVEKGKDYSRRIGSPECTEPAYYIFCNEDSGGFVIVSGDDVAKPVLGYSLVDTISADAEIPPAMRDWLKDMEKQITQVRKDKVKQDDAISSQWKAPIFGNVLLQLNTAKWNQGYPFNLQCPTDMNDLSVTGCVPTAYAILMKYYGFPLAGKGITDDYMCNNGVVTPSRNLEHEYAWDLMLMEYVKNGFNQSQANSVAQLMADIGSAIHAEYSSKETTAVLGASSVFPYFGYNPGIKKAKDDYSVEKWYEMLRSELDKSRPVLYSGHPSPEETGHAFIIDGYTDNDYFCVNWGWGGAFNGVFALDALSPGKNKYNSSQTAIFDCVPAYKLPNMAIVNNQTECPSLKAALSLASSEKHAIEIKITQDSQINFECVDENNDVTIDLNGYVLDIEHEGFYNRGKLTVTDSKGNGKILLERGNSSIIANYSSLTITGGLFINSSNEVGDEDYRRCIWTNEGSQTVIKHGQFTCLNEVLCFNGDVIIDGGEFLCNGNISVISNYNTNGTITINGGTFVNSADSPSGSDYRRCIWANEGTKTIVKQGQFTSPYQVLCFNGDAIIEGGKFVCIGNSSVVSCFNGDVIIDGGEFLCNGNNSVISNYNANGTITINGGTFVNSADSPSGSDYRRCIWTNEGTTTNVHGGKFKNSSNTQTFCFNGKAVIDGGDIENSGNGVGIASNSDVVISNCKLRASRILYTWEGATLKCSGGIYSKTVDSMFLQEGCKCITNDDLTTKSIYPFKVINNMSRIAPTIQEKETDGIYYDINGKVNNRRKPGINILIKDGKRYKVITNK